MPDQAKYISLALLAAVLYAVSTPFSKILLEYVPSTMMASLLYFGAGIGVGLLWLFRKDREELRETNLRKEDLPYTVGMIVLDIAAPICLMAGLATATAANVSLLNNFEIVATSVIAFFLFREKISGRLWAAIALITAASMLLSFEDASSLEFSSGSLLVLAACLCWGLENNCTRKISDRNVYEIVTLKGLCSGAGALAIGWITGERLPGLRWIVLALLLGFVAYGLSIFVYILAQKGLGAAKTSAYYAVSPFVAAGLSLALLREPADAVFLTALFIMIAGTVLVTADTLLVRHSHMHTHVITETENGREVVRTVRHSHPHYHVAGDLDNHHHHHRRRVGLHWV